MKKSTAIKYKTIGVLGGMGPSASAYFYQLLLKTLQQKHNAVQDYDYPQIIINSLSLSDSSENGMESSTRIINQLTKGINVLEKAGANFITIPCNSVHNSINVLRKKTKLPIISIIEKVSLEIINHKSKKILILSSKTTNNYGLYDSLKNEGIIIIKPNSILEEQVTRLILAVMGDKNIKNVKKPVIKTINSMFNSGDIDSVLLGCTELPLAITKDDVDCKIYDSLKILSEASVNYSLISAK